MANNLHISYDLLTPGQNYEAVSARIKELGPNSWAKIHLSYWYVNSIYTAAQAVEHIKQSLDKNDKVYVVDATNNASAWNSLPDNVANLIKGQWTK